MRVPCPWRVAIRWTPRLSIRGSTARRGSRRSRCLPPEASASEVAVDGLADAWASDGLDGIHRYLDAHPETIDALGDDTADELEREASDGTTTSLPFAIDDGTGLAVVDDDWLRLDGIDALRPGEHVEVRGGVRRGRPIDAIDAGYRADAGAVVIFDGGPDEIVRVRRGQKPLSASTTENTSPTS